MNYSTRPLTDEARARLKDTRQEYSRFDSSWYQTEQLLNRELIHLGVRFEWVLQIDVQESDFRLDGQLRAYKQGAKRLHPDVGGSVEAFQELEQARCVALAACPS